MPNAMKDAKGTWVSRMVKAGDEFVLSNLVTGSRRLNTSGSPLGIIHT